MPRRQYDREDERHSSGSYYPEESHGQSSGAMGGATQRRPWVETDPYGIPNQEQLATTDNPYYAKDKEYHDDDYYDDIERQRKEYDERSWSNTTENVRKRAHWYYPKKGDPPEFSKWAQEQRTSQVSRPELWDTVEQQRADFNQDQKRVAREQRHHGVDPTDMQYRPSHPLHKRFVSATIRRERPLTDEEFYARNPQYEHGQQTHEESYHQEGEDDGETRLREYEASNAPRRQ